MPTYQATGPITATIHIVSGDLRIEADDRQDTVIDVAPSNPSHGPDVLAAEQLRVEFAEGVLRVTGAKGRGVGLLRKPGSVQLVVKVPQDSAIDAATGLGRVISTGRLGSCRIRTGAGDIQMADTASLDAVTGIGAISAGHATGDASIVTGSGAVRVGHVDGRTSVKNSNGDTWLGSAGSAVRVKSSNGSVAVERALGDVKVATANGNLRVDSAERGSVDLRTALGRIEVGVPEGTAARLDLHTSYGSVVSELKATDQPRPDDAILTMSAHTSAGDILIRRAPIAV